MDREIELRIQHLYFEAERTKKRLTAWGFPFIGTIKVRDDKRYNNYITA